VVHVVVAVAGELDALRGESSDDCGVPFHHRRRRDRKRCAAAEIADGLQHGLETAFHPGGTQPVSNSDRTGSLDQV
jgi:hypothetical protein